MSITRDELLVSIKGAGGKFNLDPASFSWLSTVSKAFERIVWVSCHIYYRAAVGTNASGLVAYGVDWDSNPPETISRAAVVACTPAADHPVWQSSITQPLVLPPSRLQSRKEYLITAKEAVDKQPGTIIWANSGDESKEVGELWAKYTVRLSGTRA